MNELQRKALTPVPLSEATVQSFFDGTRSGTAEQCLKALCVSHERLRAELQGAMCLLEGDAEAKLVKALALTDTGSEEFLDAFPPRSAGERINARDIVPGWRVVEKIREVLLSDVKRSPTKADIEEAAASLFITDGGQEGNRLFIFNDDGMIDVISGSKTLPEVVELLCHHLRVKS